MTNRSGAADTDETSTPAAMGILAVLTSGRATSRSDIARELGLAASTVSLRVQELIDAGLVVETGAAPSTGGRRPRSLSISATAGYALVADLGAHHARLGRIDLRGRSRRVDSVTIDIADGPEAVLEQLADRLSLLRDDPNAGGVLRGVGVALPGPVDVERGWVDSPSRMPGWHRFALRDRLVELFGVPCMVDNDANAMALAEHATLPGIRHSIFVKAGAGIGCGVVIDGAIYHGATGAAGDITHVKVAAAGDRACSCGNVGCLETIASGAALVRELQGDGLDVHTTADVVAATRDGDPQATTRVRSAGRFLGETLSPVVNFVNPDAVFLGGLLATVEPFVAAVRSQLYESCHPLATRDLRIERAGTGADAGVLGMGRMVLGRVLAQPETTSPTSATTTAAATADTVTTEETR